MKKVLWILLLAILSGKAHASTDVNVVLSSITYSGVICSTQATPAVNPTRIDNFVEGVTASTWTLNANRIGVEVQNQDATNSVWLGYNVNVTTPTGGTIGPINPELGFQLKPGDAKLYGMTALSTTTTNTPLIYCVAANAAGAAGVQLHIESIFKQ